MVSRQHCVISLEADYFKSPGVEYLIICMAKEMCQSSSPKQALGATT